MREHQPSLRRLFDVYDYIVDNKVGIVNNVRELSRPAGSPEFFRFVAQACNTRAFVRQENFGAAGGASVDRGMALAKAIGEAIERYCGAIYDVEEFPLQAYESAPFSCVPPRELALYVPEQYSCPNFAFVPFEDTTPVRWAPTLDLMSEEICYVPAAMVFVPYTFYLGTGDSPILQPISTGLACHSSLPEATVSAICEVIERDAFTITWQARLSPPQISLDSLSDNNQELVDRVHRCGRSLTLFNITMDVGIPSILAVQRSTSPQVPAIVVSAASGLDPEHAVRKSIEEVAHTSRYMQELFAASLQHTQTSDYDNILNQDDHLGFWALQENAPLCDFLFESKERVPFSSLKNMSSGNPSTDIEILLERVSAIGHRILVTDLTTPDVEELGLAVVRAIIPGFHPLFMGYKYRALGGSRLWKIPQTLGYRGVIRESGDNPLPHPFP